MALLRTDESVSAMNAPGGGVISVTRAADWHSKHWTLPISRAEWGDNVKWETRNQDTSTLFNISDFRAECCISSDPNMGLHSLYSIKSPQMWTQILGPLCPVLLAAVTCHVSRVTLRNTDTKMLWMSLVISVDTWRLDIWYYLYCMFQRSETVV